MYAELDKSWTTRPPTFPQYATVYYSRFGTDEIFIIELMFLLPVFVTRSAQIW